MVKNGPNLKKRNDGKNVKGAQQSRETTPYQDPCCCCPATPTTNKAPVQKKDVTSDPLSKHKVSAGTSTGKPKEKCTVQVVRKCCTLSSEPDIEEDSLSKTEQAEPPPEYKSMKTQTNDEHQTNSKPPQNRRPSKNTQTMADSCVPEEEPAKPALKCTDAALKCTDANKCKHFKEQDHPLMLRYRAVLVDAKPTLIKLSEARLEESGRKQTKTECIQAAPPPTAKSTCTTSAGVLPGDVEEEFSRMKDENIAILWIIGVINIEKELQDWYDNKKRYVQEPDDLEGKILYQGKRLAQKVIDQKMPLTIHELCQSFKLAIVSNHLKNPGLHGFFLDNFPVNVMEGEESEELLIQSMVCLYFESRNWTEDKSIPPKIVAPKLKIRPGNYSENAAEAAADHFGYKTIKILNSEELEEIQIHDIDSLVKKHLEGQGLELHKIAKHVHKHRGTNPDGTSRTITEFASKVIVDHRDFVGKNNTGTIKQEQKPSVSTHAHKSKEMKPPTPRSNNTPQVSRNSGVGKSSKGMEPSAEKVVSALPQKQVSGQPTKTVNNASAAETSSGYYTSATGTKLQEDATGSEKEEGSESMFMKDDVL
ncbi:unnamed protein product [Allacma fusca]|uniref:Uncharacterized protein n=1 Tax=Allacma fusca TaxID=39272 RepID=A0A8J2PPY0_9HEXA|nr:unnamed protein product [Allacma fusca]